MPTQTDESFSYEDGSLNDDDDDDAVSPRGEDGDAYGALNLDDGAAACNASKPKFVVYDSFEEIMQHRRSLVAKVQELVGVSDDEATALLCSNHWSYENTLQNWFENEKKAKEKAGLIDCVTSTIAPPPTIGEKTCSICFDDFDANEVQSVGCEHFFCADCWTGYLSNKISEGQAVVDAHCPMCLVKVPESKIRSLVNVEDRKKYDAFICRAFIEKNYNLKGCMGVDCERAIGIENSMTSNSVPVKCTCGAEFCWLCQVEPHPCVDCEVAREWVQKTSSDAGSSEWLLQNTKPCPNCDRPIVKNGGCMHMHCSQCHHSFCWLCLGLWDKGPYRCRNNCNQFKRDNAVVEEKKRKRATESLRRYVHYSERYIAHQNAQQKAIDDIKKFKATMLDTLSALQRTSPAQCSFIMEALEQVALSRRVLKWTYVFSFFKLENEARKREFFEYIQGDMQSALEMLSGMIEKDMPKFLPPVPEKGEEEEDKEANTKIKAEETVDDADPEQYTYPPDMQETLEKDFMQYKASICNCTAVLHKFTNSLMHEVSSDLSGFSQFPSETPDTNTVF